MAIGFNFDDDFSYGRDDERDSQIAELKQALAEMRQALADLLYVSEYDFEECDFGPAYGINREREEQAQHQARHLTKGLRPSWFKERSIKSLKQFGV